MIFGSRVFHGITIKELYYSLALLTVSFYLGFFLVKMCYSFAVIASVHAISEQS